MTTKNQGGYSTLQQTAGGIVFPTVGNTDHRVPLQGGASQRSVLMRSTVDRYQYLFLHPSFEALKRG